MVLVQGSSSFLESSEGSTLQYCTLLASFRLPMMFYDIILALPMAVKLAHAMIFSYL